jgi:hypothetical protein
MLTRDDVQVERTENQDDVKRRREFIGRMERKLAMKTALHRRQRQAFKARLAQSRSW